jgi:hypothetical protein
MQQTFEELITVEANKTISVFPGIRVSNITITGYYGV